MNDEIWKRNEMDSPCIKICMIHPQEGICTGCYRTLQEIAAWSSMTPETRAEIIAALPARAPRLAKRRGGRSARLKR
ncbi:putative Fe-S protein [Marinibacterium anthonyi]|nr:putative Fe-S protein [Marinibacterium anthonyi]